LFHQEIARLRSVDSCSDGGTALIAGNQSGYILPEKETDLFFFEAPEALSILRFRQCST
jgi:hypothetical protein